MIKCPICSEELKEQNLSSCFQITLGNFISGVFKGEKVFYYHSRCLSIPEHNKNPLLTTIPE